MDQNLPEMIVEKCPDQEEIIKSLQNKDVKSPDNTFSSGSNQFKLIRLEKRNKSGYIIKKPNRNFLMNTMGDLDLLENICKDERI